MNSVILASAGGRKTQHIIDTCSDLSRPFRRLVLTYTTNAQSILVDRLLTSDAARNMPIVQGWFTFLLDNIVRPYIGSIFPGEKVSGLLYSNDAPRRGLRGRTYYLNDEGNVYHARLALLARKVLEQDRAAVLDRLERLYDEILIDEVQDLRGSDLEILDALLNSKIDVTLVGDVRQRLLSTSRSDNKNKQYDGLGLIDWFRERADKGVLSINEINESWRCCQQVVDFADKMFPIGRFAPTISHVQLPPDLHSGIWIITKEYIDEYIKLFQPACYRDSCRTRLTGTDNAITFGDCKGATEDHVLIFPTETMKSFWKGANDDLAELSRMRAYVAITRARWSVGVFADDPQGFSLPVWTP